MHYSFSPSLVASLVSLLFMQHAAAQVYQCLDSGGKKIFSQTPCAAQGGIGEKLIMRPSVATVATPADSQPMILVPGVLYGNGSAPRDWAAENAASNSRAAAADASRAASRQAAPIGVVGLRKPAPASAGQTDRQVIANCEASHGARCNSAGEIAQRRMEQRELTAGEKQQQQNAVAARRQREQEEAFNRSLRR